MSGGEEGEERRMRRGYGDIDVSWVGRRRAWVHGVGIPTFLLWA